MPAIRPVHYRELIRVFEHDGFTYDRTEGDHRIYTKPGVRRPLVIPLYRAVPVFIIKNLLRTSGMSRDRYFVLLTESST
jgi:predicted RNA binding protein YcfA (HicA-like mRNA interferase family)